MMSESPRVASLDCNSVLSTFQPNVAWASSVLNVRSKAHVTRRLTAAVSGVLLLPCRQHARGGEPITTSVRGLALTR